MTRILKVVNLSNWDNEDYEIIQVGYGGKPTVETIKPGESVFVSDCFQSGGVLFKPVKRKDADGNPMEPEAFRDDDGRQLLPYMGLEFRNPGS